ncbi:MAG: class I SAM-dependent methyltransferase [Fibrobacteres bacterium]|nr:class I SAM-dependent methyltransferase [Fibrobacterota bacterium]
MNGIEKHNPTTRFSDRTKDYAAYRPSYPTIAIDHLESRKILVSGTKIADIGAGTGKFSRLLLEKGYPVTCIEPNKEMANTGAEYLQIFNNVNWIVRSAEDTGLPANSLDTIFCAQAFHWFDPKPTRTEFKRILKTDGNLVLIWNSRKTDEDDFMRFYKDIAKKHGKEYSKIQESQSDDEAIAQFYGSEPAKLSFDNFQEFTLDGLIGRAFSSSYMPPESSPERELVKKDLRGLFEKFNKDGLVHFKYETRMYFSKLA